MLAIAAILLAIVIPWLLTSFDIDLSLASLGVLALGGVHVVFATLSSSGRPRTAGRARLLALVHGLGIVARRFHLAARGRIAELGVSRGVRAAGHRVGVRFAVAAVSR